MFSKLKEKLKSALSVFSQKTEEEAEEKVVEITVEKPLVKEEKKQKAGEAKENKKNEPVKKEIPIQKKKETIPLKKRAEEKKEIESKKKIQGIKITYFVHGTTTDNEQGICTGWNPGELSETGEKQSIQLRNLISDQHFDVIFCSDLKRAVDSAKLTFSKGPYKIIQDKRLRECNYGDLNGGNESKVKSEVIEKIYQPFPQGECYHDVEVRMAEFLTEISKIYHGKHIAIVAHQAPQLALEVLLKGKTWKQAFKEDWRHTKSWQPGWAYWMEKEVEVSKAPERPPIEEKKEQFPKVEEIKPTEEKQSFFGKIKKTFTFKKEEGKVIEGNVKKEKVKEEKEHRETKAEPKLDLKEPEKPGFFGKLKQSITTKTISVEKFEELFWELELALLENNVSVEVIEKIKEELQQELVEKPLPRDVEGKITETLKKTLQGILSWESPDLLQEIQKKKVKPYIIAFFGVNGAGKTTSVAKLTAYLQKHQVSVVLAACDTFRAAAIQQLGVHAEKLGVKMISQAYGADAAAVAYDAIKFAQKNSVEVVLIDTAGRLHSNTNLMAELEKIIRVTKPDLKLFVGESITGNDCIEQARRFNDLVELDGVILTKADVDEKGGAPLSISYTIKKPILFLGVGQKYEDFERFDREKILQRLGL